MVPELKFEFRFWRGLPPPEVTRVNPKEAPLWKHSNYLTSYIAQWQNHGLMDYPESHLEIVVNSSFRSNNDGLPIEVVYEVIPEEAFLALLNESNPDDRKIKVGLQQPDGDRKMARATPKTVVNGTNPRWIITYGDKIEVKSRSYLRLYISVDRSIARKFDFEVKLKTNNPTTLAEDIKSLRVEQFTYRGRRKRYVRRGGRSGAFIMAVLAFILVPVVLGIVWFVYQKRRQGIERRDELGYQLMSRDVEMT